MKTLKQIREDINTRIHTEDGEELFESRKESTTVNDIPMMLIFRRKSYRVYPGNQTVALYHSNALDKYLTVPFGPKGGTGLNLNEENLEEFAPLALAGAAAKQAGGYLLGKAAEKVSKYFNKSNNTSSSASSTTVPQGTKKPMASRPIRQSKSGFGNRPTTGDSAQKAKLKKSVNIELLKKMVNEGSSDITLNINGKTLDITNNMAKKIVEAYDSVNRKNKKQIENMLDESVVSFKKILNFSLKYK